MAQHQLVLLPGLDGTGHLFAPLLSVLNPPLTASVVAYPSERPLHYSHLIPYVREVIPWDKPYTLVAESFAGPLALQFAAVQWENIRAIVLCSSFVSNPLQPALKWASSFLKDSWLKKLPSESFLRKFLLGEDCPPALLANALEAIRSLPPQVLAHRLQMVLDADASQTLRSCKKPILYLQAAQDRIVGDRGWGQVSTLNSRATRVVIDGPHLLLQRNPRAVVAAIEKFLQNLKED